MKQVYILTDCVNNKGEFLAKKTIQDLDKTDYEKLVTKLNLAEDYDQDKHKEMPSENSTKIEELESKNKELEKDLSDAIAQAQEKIASASEENKELEKDLSDAIAQAQEKIASVSEENEELKKLVDAAIDSPKGQKPESYEEVMSK